jgi:predicted ATPase
VAEKAEGNPLFAEEIVSFLTERELVHAKGGKLEFDPGAVAAALPASVQSILSARVDRLSPKDRALLQAASVIGRRFDSELLAVAAEETDIDNRLASIQALDLVHTDGGSTDYVFKHALVRDALYESLLTERRQGLHARIAEEIEHRSGNRLAEVAEILAYHYSRTSRVGKAFAYLSLAGTKSLSIYSLDEAATHLTAALALLDKAPDCASDAQVTDFLSCRTPCGDTRSEHLDRVRGLAGDSKKPSSRQHSASRNLLCAFFVRQCNAFIYSRICYRVISAEDVDKECTTECP